mmetsp:Transcript_23474/g.36181  ORF Transcript_23474/g.36181 Transcript_23474/m.36181 type:complete len:119 (+) Transcript_23474:277-633(+)
MKWPFCPDCRTTVSVDNQGTVRCPCCSFTTNLSDIPRKALTITSVSADTVVPTWAKSDDEQKAREQSSGVSRATVEEPCVKCGEPEVKFYTLQLRSVDEGQTVFYECPACNHTWSVNN